MLFLFQSMVIDVDRSGFPHLMAVVGATSIDADVDTVLGTLLGEACHSGGQREAEKARRMKVSAGGVTVVIIT